MPSLGSCLPLKIDGSGRSTNKCVDLLFVHSPVKWTETSSLYTRQRCCVFVSRWLLCFLLNIIALVLGTRVEQWSMWVHIVPHCLVRKKRFHISLELVFMPLYYHADRKLSHISGSKLYIFKFCVFFDTNCLRQLMSKITILSSAIFLSSCKQD